MRPRLPCCPGLQHARQRDIMDVQTSLSGHSCSWSGILADCCGTWHQECGCSCPGEFGCSGLACVPRGVQSPPPHGLGCRPQCGRASPPFAVERLHVVVRPRQDRGAAPWSMLSSHTRPEDQAFGIQHAMPDILTACHAAFSPRGAEVWRSGQSRPRSRGWDAQGGIGLASWRPGDSSAA